jgi:Glycosyl transferases group 1
MRICLIARNRFHNDRRAVVVHHALTSAGNEVTIVAVDSSPPVPPVTSTVGRVHRPSGVVSKLLDRLSQTSESDDLESRLSRAAAETGADIYLPLHEDVLASAIGAAHETDGVVLRAPRMASAGDVDLIQLAPMRPELARDRPGDGVAFTPSDTTSAYHPALDRHHGERAVLCYRKTASNPGRYIEAALERSGVDVRVETDAIDLATVDPGTRFVLFVESPYPAIDVTGSTSVPTLFWAHHGEHHLAANLRLTERYRADAVLLAHSWHLTPWFPTPVHRFPFAVAPEMFDDPKPLADRRFDVAMIGSRLGGNAWQYQRRGRLIDALRSSLPSDRVCFREGVTPEEMASLYGDARVVVNEGGLRHYPITMRVFEAIGAGALLLTDDIPGTGALFDPAEYERLTSDPVADLGRILGDAESAQQIASRAHAHALARHTYDHRVDQLFEIAGASDKRDLPIREALPEMARLIDRDVEVQRVLQIGLDDLAQWLPDREIWSLDGRNGRLEPGSMDAVAISSGDTADRAEALLCARRYIYATRVPSGLEEFVTRHHPQARFDGHEGLVRIDLMAESYRAHPTGESR